MQLVPLLIYQKPDVQEMLVIKGIGRAVPDRFV
jgi:hypothetical protein